ncbi:MAG: hypothetical protein ABIB97_01020 [Patescibacteria group bacterium]
MTLIEIILALFIGIMVFLAITAIYFLGQQFYRSGSDRLEIVQNGRVTLDRLTRELRQTVGITTELPGTKEEPGFPPPSEIQFQDGHQIDTIRYFRYYLDGNQFKRQIIVYYFVEGEYVNWNATDVSGQPPSSLVQEDRLVGEYFSDLQFYGSEAIVIETSLEKNNSATNLRTEILGRNIQ